MASALENCGLDSRAFFAERGIDVATATNPSRRISLETMGHLWEDAVRVTDDPNLGLKAGTFVTPTTLNALGMALWSACNIRDQLRCFVRYKKALASVGSMAIQEEEGCLVSITRYELSQGGRCLISEYSQDAATSVLHSLRRQVYRRDFSPIRVEMVRSAPADLSYYEEFFGCPVSFGCSEARTYIALEDALATIPGTDNRMASATERLADEQAQRSTEEDDLLLELQDNIAMLLPQGRATLESVAGQMHLSKRTLHRKLEERGATFSQLLESYRREKAFCFIKDQHMSLGDISFMLGFSSSSNFSRAFKRWTGSSPKEYRQQSL